MPSSGSNTRLCSPRDDAEYRGILLLSARSRRVFSRDRADLAPGCAAPTVAGDIQRYGHKAPRRATDLDIHTPQVAGLPQP